MRWSVLGRNNRKRKFRDRTHHPAPKVKKLTRHKFLCQLQTRLRHHHQTYKFILSLFINRQQLAMFRSLNQWEKPNKSVNGKLWDCSIQYLHLRGVSTMSGEHILNLFQRWSLSYKYPKCFPPSFIGLLQSCARTWVTLLQGWIIMILIQAPVEPSATWSWSQQTGRWEWNDRWSNGGEIENSCN